MAVVVSDRKDIYSIAIDILTEIAQDELNAAPVRIEACKLLLEKYNLRR